MLINRRPFYWVWRVWNPFKVKDKSGNRIKDVFVRMRSKKISRQERARRKEAGEARSQWFSVKLIRTLDFSGDGD